jgi:hypothetical protein
VWNLDSETAVQFGNAGEGPGELVRPVGIVVFGDSVMVLDQGGGRSGGRVEVYSLSGAYLGHAEPPYSIPMAILPSYTASPSGTWALWAATPIGGDTRKIARVNTISGFTEAIEVPPQLLEQANGPLYVSAAISDDGTVALGNGEAEYRLVLMPSSGDLRLGGRDIPRQARDPEILDSLRVFIQRQGREFDEERFSDVPHFPTDGLAFDGAGRLWVKTTRFKEGKTVLDVFSSDLTYIGEVEVDAGARLHQYHVGEALLVGVILNNLGVPFVRVWSIDGPS